MLVESPSSATMAARMTIVEASANSPSACGPALRAKTVPATNPVALSAMLCQVRARTS